MIKPIDYIYLPANALESIYRNSPSQEIRSVVAVIFNARINNNPYLAEMERLHVHRLALNGNQTAALRNSIDQAIQNVWHCLRINAVPVVFFVPTHGIQLQS